MRIRSTSPSTPSAAKAAGRTSSSSFRRTPSSPRRSCRGDLARPPLPGRATLAGARTNPPFPCLSRLQRAKRSRNPAHASKTIDLARFLEQGDYMKGASKALAATGVEGLDDILGGGLIPNRLYLLEGMPGS